MRISNERPLIDGCVERLLRGSIAQAIELQNSYAAEALAEALSLIEQNTEYQEGDFEEYTDRALAIANESER